MLIDEYLPRYDVTEFHELRIAAPPARTYAAIWEADLAASAVVKSLLALRALPSRLIDPGGARRFSTRVTLRDVLRQGFCLLGEQAGREVVIGVTGRFWKPTGNVAPTDPARFREPVPAGMARAAWNFIVAERAGGGSLLTTETRVLCADAAALRSFRRYWLVVGPFSALIRRYMLGTIAAAALAGSDSIWRA
jgi:hypothetical protein